MKLLLLFLLLPLLFMPFSAAANSQPKVIIINFNHQVNAGSANMVRTAVNTAINDHSRYILMVINSPGGYLSDMLTIIKWITVANESGITVYTYVPPNAIAASAASYIAMATNKIIMSPGSEIGPSTPIVVGGTALEENHTESAMLKLLTSEANEWGRNSTATYEMVVADRAYTTGEALKYNIINGEESNLTDAEKSLNILNLPSLTINESVYDQFLSVLSNSTLDGVLILLGMVAIVLDLLHPTVILTIGGTIALVLGLIGSEIISASILGLLVLGISAVFLVAELKTGHGLAFLGAIITGIVGVYLLGEGIGYSPSPNTQFLLVDFAAILVVGVFLTFYVRWASSFLRRKKYFTGRESLIGAMGVVIRDLNPCGEVSVDGVRWKACSPKSEIKKGSQVRVISISELTLYVEKISDLKQ